MGRGMRGGGAGGGGGGRAGVATPSEVRSELGLAGKATYREMAVILWPYFWPSGVRERALACTCFALQGQSNAANNAAPMYLGLATDELLRGAWPVASICAYGGLRFAVSVLEEGQRLAYLRVKEIAYREIAGRVFSHLLSLSHAWHVNKKLVSRVGPSTRSERV